MAKPLVSLIVPVYNVQPYLSRSIKSLLAQDYPNLELIAVNDASPDNAKQELATFAAQDQRLKVVNLPQNRGVSAARNTGLNLATGTYVAFMDGDDWLEPHFVSGMVAAMEKGPFDLVACPFTADAPKPLKVPPFLLHSRKLGQRQLLHAMMQPIGRIRGYMWNKLYRRSVIENLHLRFDESIRIMEDELFNATYMMATSRFYYLGEPAYHHVVRPDSATHSLGMIAAIPQQLAVLSRIRKLIRTQRAAAPVSEAER